MQAHEESINFTEPIDNLISGKISVEQNTRHTH